MNEYNKKRLRLVSGEYDCYDPLVFFLYVLMRDGCPVGEIERALEQTTSEVCQYTNGWLARYAKDVADRLMDKLNCEHEWVAVASHEVNVDECKKCGKTRVG